MELGHRVDHRGRTAETGGMHKALASGPPPAGLDLGAAGRKRALAAASLPTPPGTEDLTLDDTTERTRSAAKRRRLGDTSRPVASSSKVDLAAEAGQSADAAHGLGKGQSSMSRFDPDDPFADRTAGRPKTVRPRSPEAHKPKMTYVFRGKRIQYDAPEDVVLPGESPFVGSVPRLLFPPKRSPSPVSSLTALHDGRREQDAAPTRKRDQPQPFPTPQSLRKPKAQNQRFD